MNIHTTQAAEGLPRRGFTIADVERMVETGVIGRDERFELIGGEIVPMSPKGIRHERLKQWFTYQLVRGLSDQYKVIPETTFRLSKDTFLEPDFVVYETDTGLEGLKGDTALLAIEISVSSLAYDQGRKAAIYAEFGIRELWVADALDLSVRIHRDPDASAYRLISNHASGDALTPLFDPQFELSLADYD